MQNRLKNESSPYLLQHADNPVDWYPWGEEAFHKARQQDSPIFLSVGYSTCHWCHVMAHESFEDDEIAALLNESFVCIKVDREERPDVDAVYMAVCQAMTGSGGWPMSIFLTADQKPFFAGTYFPKSACSGSIGFRELLIAVRDAWQNDRTTLLDSAEHILRAAESGAPPSALPGEKLITRALRQYASSFDDAYGGFGSAPKFPAPHNLMFLMQEYKKRGDDNALRMASKTLVQMARGGMFDHIGFGFCRYSTDRRFLIPHFEKMLYDNALLMIAYCRAFELTGNALYRDIAEKTATYVLSELRSPEGAFYSAQDADSDGEEGKYYAFTMEELTAVLGETDAKVFCAAYGISNKNNFEGKSIPNLLESSEPFGSFTELLPKLRAYRKERTVLHRDDKVLTLWNALMIAALCALYRVSQNKEYLAAAKLAQGFIEDKLCSDNTLFVSFRGGKRGAKGFLDDYAAYCYALLALYDATLDRAYLHRAGQMAVKAEKSFFDYENGGYALSGRENEALILSRKETYDGAIPSGNSLMAYDLVRLSSLLPEAAPEEVLEKQMDFLSGEAARYPAGYAMFLLALSDHLDPPPEITIVRAPNDSADMTDIIFHTGSDAAIRVLDAPTQDYRLLNGQTAAYVCKDHRCLSPVLLEDAIIALQHNKKPAQ